MSRAGNTTQRGYGRRYQQARKALLASNPLCHWGCGRPATTADHQPPIQVVGHPHLNLVPSCGKHNFGRRDESPVVVPPSRAW